MKSTFLILLTLTLAVGAFGQRSDYVPAKDVFIPRTLTAGTSMSARTDTTTMNDTTRAFSTQGYAAVYVGLEGSANDSTYAHVSYQISKDGAATTWMPFAVVDSFANQTVVGASKYIPLPAAALGAPFVRVRVYGTAWGVYGLGTATKLTTKIIRIPYSYEKVR